VSSKEIQQTSKARLILQHARDTKKAFQEQCNSSRKQRRTSGGALNYAEQDLLRAMLVFSCAGLDSLLKQLIRDSIRELARVDSSVQAELETFAERQIRGEVLGDGSESAFGRRFLARVLVSPAPQEKLIEEYIKELTGDSLQSDKQVFRTVKALGIDPGVAIEDEKTLRAVFQARNQIIHEMDIKLESQAKKARKRRSRTIDDMVEKADFVLELGRRIIKGVEEKLE